MARKLYEIAAELGMRGEHLRQMLQQEGYEFDSLDATVDAKVEDAIRKQVQSGRSTWDKLKGLSRDRARENLYETTESISEGEQASLNDLVAQEELNEPEGESPVEFIPPFSEAEEKPEPLAPSSEEKPEESIPQPESVEIQEPEIEPEPEAVEKFYEKNIQESEADVEFPIETPAPQDDLDQEIPEPVETDGSPSEEKSILDVLDRIARKDRLEEEISSDSSSEEEIEKQLSSASSDEPEQQDSEAEPVAAELVEESKETEAVETASDESAAEEEPEQEELQAQQEIESEAVPEPAGEVEEPVSAAQEAEVEERAEEPQSQAQEAEMEAVESTPEPAEVGQEEPFSADDLLEAQLGGEMSDEEEEESEEEPVAVAEEEVVEQAQEEESLDAVVDETESVEEPVATEEVEAQDVSAEPETEEDSSDSLTIDELLGQSEEEEKEEQEEPQPVAAAAESKEEEPAEDLLDTNSLLGLEFSEEDETSDQGAIDESQKEGVGIEELLGMEEKEEEKPAEPSQSEKGKGGFLRRLIAEVRDVLLRPSKWSNLELIFVSSLVLVTLTGVLYGIYRWYNYNRDGLDQAFYERAELLRKAGRLNDSLETYGMVLDHHPDSSLIGPTYLGMAEVYYRKEQYRDAIGWYEKGLAFHEKAQSGESEFEGYPDFLVIPDARMNMTRALLKTGRYEQGRDELTRLALEYPGEEIGETSRMILGDLYAQWAKEEGMPERYRNAIAEYNLALNEYPDSKRRVEILGRLAEVYRTLYQSQPDEEKEPELLQEALDEYDRAIGQARLEGRPSAEVARLSMAHADTRMEQGEAKAAVDEYNRILMMDLPLDLQVEVLEKSARAHLAMRDIEGAEKRAQELIAHNPADQGLALAYYILGDAEWDRGRRHRDFTKMMQHYQKALQLDDNSGPSGVNSQRAYMRMTNVIYLENADYEQAAEKYRMIVERYPTGPYTYRAKFYLAECLSKLERHTEAADVYREVVSDYENTRYVDPQFFRDALFRRGDSLYAAKQWDEAIEAYRQALRTLGFPDAPLAIQARERLAKCHLATHNYPLAEEILQYILDKYPDTDRDGHISMDLGQLREKTYDYDGARKAYMDLLKKNIGASVRKQALERLAGTHINQLAGAEPSEKEALRTAAIGTLMEIRTQFPEDRMTDLRIARLYREMGNLAKARQSLQWFMNRATAQEPQAEAAVMLGEIAWELENWQEAQDQFELVEQLPTYPGDDIWRARALYRKAECLRKAKQFEQAQTSYQKVVEDYSNTPWAEEAAWKLKSVDWQLEISKS